MSQSARYDGLAAWYDEFVRDVGLTAVELDVVERLLGVGPGRCVDVGCGTGIAFETLAKLGWSPVGVDVSADQLRLAGKRAAATGAEVVHADAAALPFADETFDAALSLMTHTDFDDAAAVFGEIARVLRSGARFVYVGVHPCWVSPTVERQPDGRHVLHEGYRRRGWWYDAPGFRLGREGVRGRAGVNHLPLADFLNAVVGSGVRLERVEEPGDEDYPLLLALTGRK